MPIIVQTKEEKKLFVDKANNPTFLDAVEGWLARVVLAQSTKRDYEKIRTRSGIPLPFADPALAGGLFPARLIRWHAEATSKFSEDEKLEDTRTLLSKFQLVDMCHIAKNASHRRLYLELVRNGLATLDDQPLMGMLSRTEAMQTLESAIMVVDPLRGEWPWEEQPRLLLTNPPWLRIKDRFRGYENGSVLRKELGNELRNLKLVKAKYGQRGTLWAQHFMRIG